MKCKVDRRVASLKGQGEGGGGVSHHLGHPEVVGLHGRHLPPRVDLLQSAEAEHVIVRRVHDVGSNRWGHAETTSARGTALQTYPARVTLPPAGHR